MTREEAAREIEKTIEQLNGYLPPNDEWIVALRLAISALSAEPAKLDRSRWDGCRVCKKATCLDGEVYVSGVFIMRPYFDFCPECGKPLTEEAWTEMERRINHES